MTKLDIQILIERYNANEATESELAIIEKMIESGKIQLEDLNDIESNLSKIEGMWQPEISDKADAKFYDMLANEMRKQTRTSEWNFTALWQKISQPQHQWAYSIAMLIIGSIIGFYVLNGLIRGNQIEQLTTEMAEMKQMVLLNMLEEESASERIKAVSLYAELDEVNDTVAMALIMSLRDDANVNVRLAAVDALARYTDTPMVRKELIASIAYQDSPLVQLALAELMVAMQEKNAVEEFDKIIQRQETPEEIKVEISDRMKTII
jgi:hypothetical protein